MPERPLTPGPGCSSRSQFVMVDAVPRSGSAAASLAWEQRNDRSVHGWHRQPQVVEADGVGEQEPFAHQAADEDEARLRDRRAPAPGRGRAACRTTPPTAWPVPATRACPAGDRRAAPPAIPSRRSAARRRSPVVARDACRRSIASIVCSCTSTPRSSCARVERNRRIAGVGHRFGVHAVGSTRPSDSSRARSRSEKPRRILGPAHRERLVERRVVLQRPPDVGEDVAPRVTWTPTVRWPDSTVPVVAACGVPVGM